MILQILQIQLIFWAKIIWRNKIKKMQKKKQICFLLF